MDEMDEEVRTYSKDIASAISRFLTDEDWKHDFDSRRGCFQFSMELPGKTEDLAYAVLVGRNNYTVYVNYPLRADSKDPKMMAAMAEFVCRVNHEKKFGGFDLDFNDGGIRFQILTDCPGIIPTQQMVKNSIYWPSAMFLCYHQSIQNIILGGMSAEEAIVSGRNADAEKAGEGEEVEEEGK